MPKLPPTSLQITRTLCSDRRRWRARMSWIMFGAWQEWYTVSRCSDGSKSARITRGSSVTPVCRPIRKVSAKTASASPKARATSPAAPLMEAHASSWTLESLSRTLPRRPRGAPARLKPRGLLRIQDQPLDPSVTDDMHGRPVHVPAAQARRVRRAIAREDPLLAEPVCEVADVGLDLTRFGGHCRSHES